jgi:hypothetical protein
VSIIDIMCFVLTVPSSRYEHQAHKP